MIQCQWSADRVVLRLAAGGIRITRGTGGSVNPVAGRDRKSFHGVESEVKVTRVVNSACGLGADSFIHRIGIH